VCVIQSISIKGITCIIPLLKFLLRGEFGCCGQNLFTVWRWVSSQALLLHRWAFLLESISWHEGWKLRCKSHIFSYFLVSYIKYVIIKLMDKFYVGRPHVDCCVIRFVFLWQLFERTGCQEAEILALFITCTRYR